MESKKEEPDVIATAEGFIEPQPFCKVGCCDVFKIMVVLFIIGFIAGVLLHDRVMKLI